MTADPLSSSAGAGSLAGWNHLPTFFVIGAPKAGTTSLHHYLGAHPEVEMTSAMEPHVFSGAPSRWSEKRLWRYGILLRGEAAVRGDASPGYAAAPIDAQVPERIARYVPHARLIYLVRDPVERALAHHAQATLRGAELRPAGEAIDLEDPGCPYVACSRYATQVESYRRHFDTGALLVVDQARLRADRRAVMARIYGFLGVDPEFWSPGLERQHNVRGVDNVALPGAIESARRSRLGRRLRVAMPGLTRAASRRLRPRFARRSAPSPVPAGLRDRLCEALRPEAQRLREQTGQGFETWSV